MFISCTAPAARSACWPVPRLDAAIELARQPDVTLVSYGDMLRVPASRRRSLLKARAQGADVRMAYSALEALEIAAGSS